jgi:hypothetical protein
MVQERFDSDSFSDVFAGGAPPLWLGLLIKERRGRKLLYQLSSTHKNCLLLNFAMQSILQKVGLQKALCMSSAGHACHRDQKHSSW